MLIPDNIHPEQTIYFNGSIVLQEIQKKHTISLLDLYEYIQSAKKMSWPVLILSLDWLFLINVVTIDRNGNITLCS
jgi:hypothetical protein